MYVPNSYLVRLDTPYLDPRVQGAQKGGPVGFWSLSRAFWWKLDQQKLLGTPNLVGVGHLIGPQIQIWKDQGLDSFSRGVYKTKVVVNVANSAWPQGQGYPIMLESSYKTLH